MSPRGGGFLDAARQILEEAGEPLHGLEIVRRGRDRNMFTSRAKDDQALVRSITSDIKRSGNPRHMTFLGRAYFGLEEWGPTQEIPTGAKSTPLRRSVQSVPVVPSGITLEMLEQTRQMMPQDQFRQIWGGIYDQLLADERRKAITPVNDRFLAEKARVIVQRVQDYLQGRSTESPKSETVCDWIFTCYNLELYREGAALWRYVNKDEVNAWLYERTAKLSAACRARTGL